jgi:anti-sigma regulatory factor (Ser/Thr protein kinase)
MARPKNQELREFLLQGIREHPEDITNVATARFGVTRASVNGYLRSLIAEGLVGASGKTKSRKYELKQLDLYSETLSITAGLAEDRVLREHLAPYFSKLSENVRQICEYGFTEMLNNAIEHSEGKTCTIGFERTYTYIRLFVNDDGVGIFDKIARECRLADKREAILELSKGKLTTDSKNHTGEGIFFTSRMFDKFSIISGGLGYQCESADDEWLIEAFDKTEPGTLVGMEISCSATQTSKEIFDRFVDDNDRFSRTHVPLALAKYEGEALVSRSQARRLLSRVERFSEVMLDFSGINEVGQAFADEIFRVWARDHPKTKIVPFRANDTVRKMIQHAFANAREDAGIEDQPMLPLGPPSESKKD